MNASRKRFTTRTFPNLNSPVSVKTGAEASNIGGRVRPMKTNDHKGRSGIRDLITLSQGLDKWPAASRRQGKFSLDL